MDPIELTNARRSPQQVPGVPSATEAAGAAPDSRAEVSALRTALRSQLHAQLPGQTPDGQLRRAVHLLCEEARRQQVQVEHVILLLKREWQSLPEVRQLPSGGIAADLLSAVVSLTIDEYYAARG